MIAMNQRGMTLVEILIATAIWGLIVTLPGTAIYQFINVVERGSVKMTALHEVQNAAHWVARDGQMASAAVGGSQLALTLPDNTTITYELVGTGPRYELRRTAGGPQIAVARNVTSASFSVNGRVITMTITSSPESRWGMSEERTYKVYRRPTG